LAAQELHKRKVVTC